MERISVVKILELPAHIKIKWKKSPAGGADKDAVNLMEITRMCKLSLFHEQTGLFTEQRLRD